MESSTSQSIRAHPGFNSGQSPENHLRKDSIFFLYSSGKKRVISEKCWSVFCYKNYSIMAIFQIVSRANCSDQNGGEKGRQRYRRLIRYRVLVAPAYRYCIYYSTNNSNQNIIKHFVQTLNEHIDKHRQVCSIPISQFDVYFPWFQILTHCCSRIWYAIFGRAKTACG